MRRRQGWCNQGAAGKPYQLQNALKQNVLQKIKRSFWKCNMKDHIKEYKCTYKRNQRHLLLRGSGVVLSFLVFFAELTQFSHITLMLLCPKSCILLHVKVSCERVFEMLNMQSVLFLGTKQ